MTPDGWLFGRERSPLGIARPTVPGCAAGAGKGWMLDRPGILASCIGERGVKRWQGHPQTDALGFATQLPKRLER